MKLNLVIIFGVAVIVDIATAGLSNGPKMNTAERIEAYNYPVEVHNVQSGDGYILTMFRIPYSPRLNNEYEQRPVAFLQHGLIGSSDCWILNGPDNALAYLFADAGYDVWMGNARGNTYSKRHVKLPSSLPKFWDFSWNEIAIYDMPAMIDYVLDHTNETALHYVGHSQGTTVFFVLMSLMPEYNEKIKTSHMLAPVAYMKHLQSPIVRVLRPLLGYPTLITEQLGESELLPSNRLLELLGSRACANSSKVQEICANLLFLVAGYDSQHLNYTLLPDVVETHPAGSSTKQLIHYVQEHKSGFFRKYDHGSVLNLAKYGQWTPPNYKVKYVSAPVRLYYSDNDFWAAVEDVKKLEGLLPNVVDSYNVPIPEWNHLDFMYALEVKELLYDKIISSADYYEETGDQ